MSLTGYDLRIRIESDLWELYEQHEFSADMIDDFVAEKMDEIRADENEKNQEDENEV